MIGEELGQVGLEEVVDEPVHVEHRPAVRVVAAAAHQRGDDGALVVVPEVDRAALVGLAENVNLHVSDPTRSPSA